MIGIGAVYHPCTGVNSCLAANRGGEGLAEAMFEDVREFGARLCTIRSGWVKKPLVEAVEGLDPDLVIKPGNIARTVLFVLSITQTTRPTEITTLPQRSPHV